LFERVAATYEQRVLPALLAEGLAGCRDTGSVQAHLLCLRLWIRWGSDVCPPSPVRCQHPGGSFGVAEDILVLAMITTWRWDRADQLPNGRQLGTQWLRQIRSALDRNSL
jgi:hypothetical protein